ncbi:MAG: proprotein convertase P-domain-containing protein [Myxococcota bacterium]|nr:proprotein convertase P-domain-containing protein [Myxococcota bacterium]
MKQILGFHLGISLVAIVTAGCGSLQDESEAPVELKERWNATNDPIRFTGISLKYSFDDLPTSGRAEREIWPSTYWATKEDSINVRWSSGELSPAEKYDKAFNGWVPEDGFMALRPYREGPDCKAFDPQYYEKLGPLATHIAENMGNRKARDGVDSDGDGEIDECGDRDGVEAWWGLCHAWVPAAMLEDRPLNSIEYNGVTFHPGDLEALLIAAYNKVSAQMIGGRCNDKGADIERDAQGRPVDSRCRDTNPGTLHVIMTNYLGLNRTSFAEDRTYDYEVWNQPIVAYEIIGMEEVSVERAQQRLGLTGEIYTPNPDAVFLYDVSASLTYITESHASQMPADAASYERTDEYTYILELDENRQIIGGEWYGASRKDHPDFLWSPRRAVSSTVPFLDLDTVRMLVELSRKDRNDVSGPAGQPFILEALPDIAIPDDDPAGVTIELAMPEGITGELSATVIFSHEDLSQVKVGLLSPTGESWPLVDAQTATGSAFYERTIVLNPQPIGELTGHWKLVVVDISPSKTGLVELFQLSVQPN